MPRARAGVEHFRPLAPDTAAQMSVVASDPAAEPQRLFTELGAPLSGRSLAEAPPWEIELALGAGMVLRIRRSEPC